MRFEVGRRRTAIAARSLSYALVAVTVGLVAITTAFYSQGALPANPIAHSSSSSLLSSSSVLSSSSSTTAQPAVQAAQYPLVWGPNPVSACDSGPICIDVTLGFLGQTATTNTTESATTIIANNTTTIINSSVTTYIKSNEIDYVQNNPVSSYVVTLSVYIQDAITGQNATTPGTGGPVVQSACDIQPTGFTNCTVYAPYSAGVPSGHPYKVTVFVTKNSLPCSLQEPGLQCSSLLLAPPSPTITVSE